MKAGYTAEHNDRFENDGLSFENPMAIKMNYHGLNLVATAYGKPSFFESVKSTYFTCNTVGIFHIKPKNLDIHLGLAKTLAPLNKGIIPKY